MIAESQIVVVGGTRGLGKNVAERFAAIPENSVTVISRLQNQSQPHIKAVFCDLHTLEKIDDVVRQIRSGAPLRYLVFAQRYRGDGDVWAGEMQVGLTATKRIIEALLPLFVADGDRAITLVSSVYADVVGSSQPVGYHVAKAGLKQMGRYYAATLGPLGIRVNSVLPMTYLKDDAPDWKRAQSKEYEVFVPIGRMADVTDVTDAIEFLSSKKASYISGQSLTIDGGTSCVWNEELAQRLK